MRIIRNLLGKTNLHTVLTALEIITVNTATCHEEDLKSEGVVACLDTMKDSKNTDIRKKSA
ncbi:MAG: hypothetical protein WCF90_05675 [Methanomicrobiales archaeon]